jgi:proteasome lid subunit RPN8/RPN11
LEKVVYINQSVVDSILSYAKSNHPREGILLLRGRVSGDRAIVEDLVIPPFAIHGEGFSSFPLHSLPFDISVIGVVHSHPSGVLSPSLNDLNNFYGKIMVIAAFPYESDRDIAVFNDRGDLLKHKVIQGSSGAQV